MAERTLLRGWNQGFAADSIDRFIPYPYLSSSLSISSNAALAKEAKT